jgi:hypothetical protein
MMAVEEGDILIQVEGRRGIVQKSPSITDRCIDNSKRDVLNLITFCLAMGNAADAVEIMAIGFIMAELDVSQIEKGIIHRVSYLLILLMLSTVIRIYDA